MNNGSPVPASIFTIERSSTSRRPFHVGASDRTASQHVADRFEDDHGDDRSTTENATGWLQSYLEVEDRTLTAPT
jgi:hypothetical protein